MPIEYLDWITRDMVQRLPAARFVFGDNMKRQGYGGQAKSMRGEPNAIGICTKRAPGMKEENFFSDSNKDDMGALAMDLVSILDALNEGRTIYVPKDGLGTGLSQLPQRAPKLYWILWEFFNFHSSCVCPWPKPTWMMNTAHSQLKAAI